MIDQSVRGDEKLTVEIEKKKIPEYSEPSTERLMRRSETLRAGEKHGSSSWVVEMERMIEDTSPSVEEERWKKVSIYRVPEWHKDLFTRKAYQPSLVSMGPFHHCEPDLLRMEEHKRRAVMHLVKRAGRPLGEFVAAIEEVVDKLLDAYQGLNDKWRGEKRGRFVEMMVTDGCFFLEIQRAFQLAVERKADDDYAANDPVFSKHGLYYLIGKIKADMVVIENQLPLLALERLVVFSPARLRHVLNLFDAKVMFY